MRRHDGFWMELDAVNRMLAVLHGMHFEWIILRNGDDFQLPAAGPSDDQRVISHDFHRRRQAGEYAGSVVLICDVLPCITRSARTTSPPYASPIAWCPRHTPRIGIVLPHRRITSTVMPASFGVHGPGESTMADGARSPISST